MAARDDGRIKSKKRRRRCRKLRPRRQPSTGIPGPKPEALGPGKLGERRNMRLIWNTRASGLERFRVPFWTPNYSETLACNCSVSIQRLSSSMFADVCYPAVVASGRVLCLFRQPSLTLT